MSDEKTTQDDAVDSVESAPGADSQSVQPAGKRRRQGAPARDVADESAVETEVEEGSTSRFKEGAKAFFGSIGAFFKSVWEQLTKVIWPTRKEMLVSVVVVLVFLVITVALVFGVDTGAGELIRVIFQDPKGTETGGGGGFPLPGM